VRRGAILAVLALALAAAGLWRFFSREAAGEEAYVAERRVTVWNRVAQVREALAELSYGDRLRILERKGESARVRTAAGLSGWVEERYLVAPAEWERAAALREQTRAIPVQARGRTRVTCNVRAAPGRTSPRIFQFRRGVEVEVLARGVAEWTPGEESGAATAAESRAPRKEDWLLVRATTDEAGEVAGWVLGRFIEYDLPVELREYAAGMRFVAWFEVSRVAADGREMPQYLALGARGAEGQACDFSLLRVYTWNRARHRYETAYLESNLCGHLPVRLERDENHTMFHFRATSRTGEEQRSYRMSGTTVRRVRTPAVR
jgi:hypothetical protein